MSIKSVSGIICSKAPEREPKVGILLGSGLGSFTDLVEDQIIISYDDFKRSILSNKNGIPLIMNLKHILLYLISKQ